MPNLTIRKVCVIIREFFDEFKKGQYAFDIITVDYLDGEWEMECEVTNFPECEPIGYIVRLDDRTGEILEVARQLVEEEGDDDEAEEEEEAGEEEGEAANAGGAAGFRRFPR